MTLTEGALESYCVGSEITNLTNGTGPSSAVNITFYVYDTSNNLNQTTLSFSVQDTTPQNISSITISASTTSATVTIVANESVNATANSTGSNSFTNVASNTYGKTKTLSLSSLSASTAYNLSVITCDRAGNCLTNTTLGFTTSAAAAAAAEAAAAAAAGGGGGAAPSNVVASAGRQWDTLAGGSSGVLTINNEKIAVTGVVIDVKNTVTNPSITVESLSSNPLTTSAAAKVYQYLQIRKSNIADADASKITVKFRVPKSWLASNGVAEADIVLWRYNNAWDRLDTKLVSSDSNYAHYESITPGLSTFAIGNKEGGISAFAIIDTIRDFYAGTSKLTAFDIIDQIRAFYGG
jgi:PGF-pre-PGF domain-containing protein